MEKENARKQTLEQLHERRKQVVRLHKKGIKIMQIVEMTGLSYPPVRATIDLFEAGGWGAIRPALRGRSPGDGRVLSPAQEETIQRMIIDKRPEQLKMDFHLWSRAAVSQLIEQEFGVKLQTRSIGKYLTRWGFTPQKPIKRAYEQSPAAKLIEFLQALIKDAGKKVFLILDNLRVHHSKLVKAWVAEHQDQIELFYLPSYSPQLNPEERLNADLKQEIGKRVPVRTKAKLREAANDHMAMLEQNPERVIGYFQDRYVRYAA